MDGISPTLKCGTPTNDELEELGDMIGEKWRKLGRRLCVSDESLDEIDLKTRTGLSENGYRMLKLWKEKEGSAATYEVLCDALKHKLVLHKDLAEKFCYIYGPPTASPVQEERETGEVPGASAGTYVGGASGKDQDNSGRVRTGLKRKRGHPACQLPASQVQKERVTGEVPGDSGGTYVGGASCKDQDDSSVGSLSWKIHLQMQDPEKEKVKRIMSEKAYEVLGLFDLSTPEGISQFRAYLLGELLLINVELGRGCLKVNVKCLTLEILERLWADYCSGHLNEVAEKCLITEKVKEELGMETIKLTTTILEDDYLACRLSLMQISSLLFTSVIPRVRHSVKFKMASTCPLNCRHV